MPRTLVERLLVVMVAGVKVNWFFTELCCSSGDKLTTSVLLLVLSVTSDSVTSSFFSPDPSSFSSGMGSTLIWTSWASTLGLRAMSTMTWGCNARKILCSFNTDPRENKIQPNPATYSSGVASTEQGNRLEIHDAVKQKAKKYTYIHLCLCAYFFDHLISLFHHKSFLICVSCDVTVRLSHKVTSFNIL